MEYLEEVRLLVIDMVSERNPGKVKARPSVSGTDEQENSFSALAPVSRSKMALKKNVAKPSEVPDRNSRRSTSVSKGDRRRSSFASRNEKPKLNAETKMQAQGDEKSAKRDEKSEQQKIESVISENMPDSTQSVVLPIIYNKVDINLKQGLPLAA